MKKKYKIISSLLIVMLCFTLSIMSVFAEATGNEEGGGSGAGGSSSSSRWPRWQGKYLIAGIRMTVVDQNGVMIPGTHTIDFVNDTSIRTSSVRMNANAARHKGGVISSGVSWKGNPSGLTMQKAPVEIKFDNQDNLKIAGTGQATYFNNLAKTDALYNNYIAKTGYKRTSNYNKHYILVEPTSLILVNGKYYYGTATELAKVAKGSAVSVPYKYLARSTCYNGNFIKAGKKDNGVTLEKGNELKAYVAVDKDYFKDGECTSVENNNNLTKKINGKYNGNGVGIYYAAAMMKTTCDINNPSHFHKVITNEKDKNYENQDYISVENDDGTGTALCCEQMSEQYGQAYVEKLYPICGACEVSPHVTENKCNNSNSGVILTDVLNTTDIDSRFTCLYKGVSSKSGNKYSYSSRESVRKQYKAGKIGKYCEVYCIEDVVADFPDDYRGIVGIGGTFIWPSYNRSDPYQATVSSTRTCKVRFRQQEWLNAFKKGNQNTLLKQLTQCMSSDMNSYANDYVSKLNPTLNLSYQDGIRTISNKTLVVGTKANGQKDQTITTNCPNCSKSTSGLTISNVESQLNNINSMLNSKVLTVNVHSRYVLPNNLFQYANKQNNQLEETISASEIKQVESNNQQSKYMDTGSSKLKVNDRAKADTSYKLMINYSGLSTVSGKFKYSGEYICEYKTNKGGPTDTVCDYNEPQHFETNTSGPNGEDCCEYFAKKYGTDSKEYQELVKRGDCPACDPEDPNCPNGGSCTYPDDLKSSDVITKKKCCSMCLVDRTCSAEDYKKYCSNPNNLYCPQDCVNGVCHNSSMTQAYRSCIQQNQKSPGECMSEACYGGNILIYRPISLYSTNGTSEAFPGAEWPRGNSRIWSNDNWYYYSNWAYRGKKYDRDYYVDTYITNNRGVKEYAIYNMKPMYTIKMNSKTIQTIRSYNKDNSYDDFKLNCNKNGRQCRSDFVKQYATGCGIGNWYACAGISAKRGD